MHHRRRRGGRRAQPCCRCVRTLRVPFACKGKKKGGSWVYLIAGRRPRPIFFGGTARMDHAADATAHHVPSLDHWRGDPPPPPFLCRWKCGAQMPTPACIYMHQAAECPLRVVACECGERMPFCRIVPHRERACPATPHVTPSHVHLARARAYRAARAASLVASTQAACAAARVVAAAAALDAAGHSTRANNALPPHERTKEAFATFVSRATIPSPWAERIAHFHEGHCDHRQEKCAVCHWLGKMVAWHTRSVHGPLGNGPPPPCPFPLCDHHLLPCFWSNCPERVPLRDREYHALLCTSNSAACPSCANAAVPHPRRVTRDTRGTKRVPYASMGWVERKWHTLQCRRTRGDYNPLIV